MNELEWIHEYSPSFSYLFIRIHRLILQRGQIEIEKRGEPSFSFSEVYPRVRVDRNPNFLISEISEI